MPPTRVHESWLAAREKALLIAIARSLPSFVTPDRLTALGILGAALTGACYLGSRWSHWFLLPACVGLGLNWFGDSLDGTLARTRRIERPRYGYFVDHATDVVAQVFIFLGLGASPYLRFDGACLILLSYWMAALLTFIRALATGIFQISYYGVGPTEIRIALALYTLAVFFIPRLLVPGTSLSLIDLFAFVLFPAVFLLYSASLVSIAATLRREQDP